MGRKKADFVCVCLKQNDLMTMIQNKLSRLPLARRVMINRL